MANDDADEYLTEISCHQQLRKLSTWLHLHFLALIPFQSLLHSPYTHSHSHINTHYHPGSLMNTKLYYWCRLLWSSPRFQFRGSGHFPERKVFFREEQKKFEQLFSSRTILVMIVFLPSSKIL